MIALTHPGSQAVRPRASSSGCRARSRAHRKGQLAPAGHRIGDGHGTAGGCRHGDHPEGPSGRRRPPARGPARSRPPGHEWHAGSRRAVPRKRARCSGRPPIRKRPAGPVGRVTGITAHSPYPAKVSPKTRSAVMPARHSGSELSDLADPFVARVQRVLAVVHAQRELAHVGGADAAAFHPEQNLAWTRRWPGNPVDSQIADAVAAGPSASWLSRARPSGSHPRRIRRPIRQALRQRGGLRGKAPHPSGAHRVGLDRPPPLNRRSAEHDLPATSAAATLPDPAENATGEPREISHGLVSAALLNAPPQACQIAGSPAARAQRRAIPRSRWRPRPTIARYISARPVAATARRSSPGRPSRPELARQGATRPPGPGGKRGGEPIQFLAAAQQAADPSQRTARAPVQSKTSHPGPR